MLRLSTALIALFVVATPTLAGDFYGKFFAGGSLPGPLESDGSDWDFASGQAWGGAIGMNIADTPFSFEVDVLKSSADYPEIVPWSLEALTVMANAVAKADIGGGFGLYAGGGAGFVQVSNIFSSATNTGNGLGYQAFAGLDFALSPNLSLLGEVRYQATTEPVYTDSYFTEYNRTFLMVGLKASTD